MPQETGIELTPIVLKLLFSLFVPHKTQKFFLILLFLNIILTHICEKTENIIQPY